MMQILVFFVQLSTKLLQDGRHEELERVMAEKERQQELELEAAEVDMDLEEAEHIRQISQGIDEEHLKQTEHVHKNILNNVSL